MMPELLALIPASAALPDRIGPTLRSGEWQAVLARGSAFRLLQHGRKAALRDAKARLRGLEALLPVGCVLPCLPGTRLPQAEIGPALTLNAPDLARWASRITGSVQYQLTVSCDIDRALLRFVQTESLGPVDDAGGLRRAICCAVTDRLSAVVGDLERLPVTGNCVFNAVLLLDSSRSAGLDRALEEIDALWSEGLAIRLVGPTPPMSFCSIGFRKIDRRRLREAEAVLGVGPDVPLDALAAARRRRLMAGPSDPEEVRAATDMLERAARRPDASRGFHAAFLWREGRAVTVPGLKGAA